MQISAMCGIKNYNEILVSLKNSSEFCRFFVSIYIMGISRHFGIENYAWKLGIIENFF